MKGGGKDLDDILGFCVLGKMVIGRGKSFISITHEALSSLLTSQVRITSLNRVCYETGSVFRRRKLGALAVAE